MKEGFVCELLGSSDYAISGEIVGPQTKVLDLGCGEGELLEWLASNKGVDARGVEISGAKVQKAIARGVSVLQCDIGAWPAGDRGVSEFRPLADEDVDAVQRAGAAHVAVSLRVVRIAEYSSADGAGFRSAGRAGIARGGAALLPGRSSQGGMAAQSDGGSGGIPGQAGIAPMLLTWQIECGAGRLPGSRSARVAQSGTSETDRAALANHVVKPLNCPDAVTNTASGVLQGLKTQW